MDDVPACHITPDHHTKMGSGHYRQVFGSVIVQFAEHSVSAAMDCCNNRKLQQKTEDRKANVADKLWRSILSFRNPWEVVQIFSEDTNFFSSENWSQGNQFLGVNFQMSVHKLIFILLLSTGGNEAMCSQFHSFLVTLFCYITFMISSVLLCI